MLIRRVISYDTVYPLIPLSFGMKQYLTLRRRVSFDAACHGSPSSPVLSGLLGVHEGPLDDVVTQLQSWSSSSSFALNHALYQIALQRIVPHDVPVKR